MTETRHLAALLLFVLSVLVYNANLRHIGSEDTVPTRLVAVSVARDYRLDLDRFFGSEPPRRRLPYWLQYTHGHYVSSYPVLPALLAAPLYFVPVRVFGVDSWSVINIPAKLTASLLASVSVLFVYLASRRVASESAAVALSLVYAFGTSTASVSSQALWGHAPAQLFLAVALYCALRSETEPRFLDGVGIASGLMLASRPSTAIVAAALIGYVSFRDWRRGIRSLGLLMLVVLPVVLYNVRTFGTVSGGYPAIQAHDARLMGHSGGWSGDLVESLPGLLFSPNRGLFVYSPVLLFAVLGAARSFSDPRRAFFHCILAGLAASMLVVGKYSVWWSGHAFGPRLLADFAPILVLLIAPCSTALERSRLFAGAFASLFAVSVFIHLIGAFYYPSPRAREWDRTPQNVDLAPGRVWHWKDTQLRRLLQNGPHPIGFSSQDSGWDR